MYRPGKLTERRVFHDVLPNRRPAVRADYVQPLCVQQIFHDVGDQVQVLAVVEVTTAAEVAVQHPLQLLHGDGPAFGHLAQHEFHDPIEIRARMRSFGSHYLHREFDRIFYTVKFYNVNFITCKFWQT